MFFFGRGHAKFGFFVRLKKCFLRGGGVYLYAPPPLKNRFFGMLKNAFLRGGGAYLYFSFCVIFGADGRRPFLGVFFGFHKSFW